MTADLCQYARALLVARGLLLHEHVPRSCETQMPKCMTEFYHDFFFHLRSVPPYTCPMVTRPSGNDNDRRGSTKSPTVYVAMTHLAHSDSPKRRQAMCPKTAYLVALPLDDPALPEAVSLM